MMNKSQRKLLLLLSLFVLTACFFSCKKKEEKPAADENPPVTEPSTNEKIYSTMKEWYFWYDKIPVVDPKSFSSPADLLNAIMYKAVDKWSYVEKTGSSKSIKSKNLYSDGQTIGYGYGWYFDIDNILRVSYVYNNSPAYRAGIRRCWKFLKINGKEPSAITDWATLLGDNTVGVQNTFEFQDTLGNIKNISLAKEVVTMNAVLCRKVIQTGNHKVGYLVFNYFFKSSDAEIDEAFAHFQSNAITDLVVDLRYNTGGLFGSFERLANNIAPASANGQVFYKLKHNTKKADRDSSIKFVKNNPLSLNTVIFITSKITSGLSEMLINGLKPYMNVVLIGGNTAGDPVGNYTWNIDNYALRPICFKVENALGISDFYNGFMADVLRYDGLDKDLGDPAENRLKEALYYINNGSFSITVSSKNFDADWKNETLIKNGIRGVSGMN